MDFHKGHFDSANMKSEYKYSEDHVWGDLDIDSQIMFFKFSTDEIRKLLKKEDFNYAYNLGTPNSIYTCQHLTMEV